MHPRKLAEQLLNREDADSFFKDLEDSIESFISERLLKTCSIAEALEISSYELEQLYAEAWNCYEQGAYSDAVLLFRWLVIFDPYVFKFWMGFGAAQQLLQLYTKALQAYAVAAFLETQNLYPHYYAGQCYMLMNNKEEAYKALKCAYSKCQDENGELGQQINKKLMELRAEFVGSNVYI